MSHSNTLRKMHTQHYNLYKNQQKVALDLVHLLHQLQTEYDILFTLFGESISNVSATHLLASISRTAERNHGKAINIIDVKRFIEDFLAEVAKNETVTIATIDIGQVLIQKLDVSAVIESIIQDKSKSSAARDVVLYGFGRIGRILTRLLLSQSISDKGLQLKAIVVRPAKNQNDIFKRASLLERDSIHGTFNASVEIDTDNNGIVINGRFIQLIYANDPSEVDYTKYGINNAILIDNTGIWKDKQGLSKHLQAKGIQKVLLTAPANDGIKNIVYSVNNHTIGDDTMVSAASCTTNAITPTLKVVDDEYAIESGHIETIHSFTNDQNLIDNYHKSDRRGRSAVLNMVITSTGAAKAVGKALPNLDGKLTGNAIRVPTPNVSLAILNLHLKSAPQNAHALNHFLHKIANSPTWQSQIAYSDSPEAVSTDFVGTKYVAIVDSLATIVTGNHVTVYIWYDNEVGYSTQVLRVAGQMAGINYAHVPS